MSQDEVIIKSEDTHIDLCVGCLEEIKLFVNKPDEFNKKPGRKKKEQD